MPDPLHRIELEPSGQVFFAQPGQTILAAAIQQNILWPYRCRNGACGSCWLRCITGRVSYPGMEPMLSPKEQNEGWISPCLAVAETDLCLQREE